MSFPYVTDDKSNKKPAVLKNLFGSEDVIESNENERLLGQARAKAQIHILHHRDHQPPSPPISRADFRMHGMDKKGLSSSSSGSNRGNTKANHPVVGEQQSDRMTQYDNNITGNTQQQQREQQDEKQHTKLDMQKFSQDKSSRGDVGGVDGVTEVEGEQNIATINLTPTSLDATTATTIVAVPTTTIITNAASVGGSGIGGDDSGGNASGRSYAHEPEYKGPKWWLKLISHWPNISEHCGLLAIFIALWAIGYVQLGDAALPNTVVMRIAFLFVGAQISGILITFLRLPDMLGMLFFGVLYTNIGFANFKGYEKLEAFLRELALINIMLLAGLGLDGNAFKRLWFMILRLTLVPTITEVAAITLLAHFTLGMPWLWGILLGLVITAVSPNVVVTVMLKLREERLGLNNGIHTLIYAMTTCNDVVSIFLFGVILGVIFSTGSLTEQILQGPIGIGIGIVFGYLYGLMLQFLPSRNSAYVNGQRFVLTVLGGCISVMGSRAIGYTSAGALGCVIVAFIAGIGWKRDVPKLTPDQVLAHQTGNVPKRLDLLWKFLKPVSFSLIGKEINFAVLDGKVVGYGMLLIVVGSLFRLVFAYLSTCGGNLSRKERAYITISGFPKATVQAALGPIALDMARTLASDDATTLSLANNVLVISVLAIICTAPLGAILMLRLAPLWLKHGEPELEEQDQVVQAIPNTREQHQR